MGCAKGLGRGGAGRGTGAVREGRWGLWEGSGRALLAPEIADLCIGLSGFGQCLECYLHLKLYVYVCDFQVFGHNFECYLHLEGHIYV